MEPSSDAPPPAWPNPSPLRADLVERALALLGRTPNGGRPNALAILGPRGTGTSHIARASLESLAAGTVAPSSPQTLRVDLRGVRGGHPAIQALFRNLDPAFNAQGAATEHLTLLWLRRMRSEGRPFQIWLDNFSGSWPALARFLPPLLDPRQILPEGVAGLPRYVVVVSGEGPSRPWEDLPGNPPALSVPPWERSELEALSRRVLAGPGRKAADPRAVDRLVGLLLTEDRGLSSLSEILSRARAAAREAGRTELRAEDLETPHQVPWRLRQARSFDAFLLGLLKEMSTGAPLPLSALTRGLRGRCASLGVPVPSVARLWRRLRRLETLGLVSREIRVGGPGGTRSLLSLHDPADRLAPAPRSDPNLPTRGPSPDGPLPPPGESWDGAFRLSPAHVPPRAAGGERPERGGW